MPTNQEIARMAHLMRRAGFGATYAELEQRAAEGYTATVEELLNPMSQPTWRWIFWSGALSTGGS